MRELILLRHAKSSWKDDSLPDRDRPLAQRGAGAAKAVGAFLKRRGWLPDRVLVSPAERTRQTWALVDAGLGAKVEPVWADGLYEAQPADLLAALRQAPDTAERVLLIGHNPGIERLAAELAGSGSDKAGLQRLAEKFPTAALARFEVAGAWAALAAGGARLVEFVTPHDL